MSVLPDCVSAEDRLQRVRELSEFTQTCQTQLGDIFETLGWTWDQTRNGEEEMVQCPLDPGHRVPQSSLHKHTASCRLRKMGYTSEELAQVHDFSVCYENTSVKSFLMDKLTQQQVIVQARAAAPLMKMEGVFWQGQFSSEPVEVPQNHQRALCDLTVADRLALYDHVTAVLSNQREAQGSSNDDLYVDLVKKLQRGEEQNEPKSHLELMAEMRDYKRRRQSYRAKNVHITKKSYTEVIREVINIHSEELSKQWRDEEQEEEEESTPEPSSHRHHYSDQVARLSPESQSRRGQSRERSHNREHKKKKKKRQRDSCSPDKHQERKKKKKRKKDEREKEK